MNNVSEDIMLALYRLSRSMRERTRQQAEDLSMQQWFVLHLLADGISSGGALAKELSVSPPTVSALIDQLVQQGLIERVPSEQDRRTIRLKLTTGGRFKIEQAKLQKLDRMSQILKVLDAADIAELQRILTKLASHAEAGALPAEPVLTKQLIK
jgi:DNA-binding MarR family transcriptional regulator